MDFLNSLGEWKLSAIISTSFMAGMLLAPFVWFLAGKKSQTQYPEFCQSILGSLTRPKEWVVDEFTVSHKSSGMSIWTANGYDCFRIYRPFEQTFPRTAKRQIFNEVARMKQKKITQMLEDS